MKILVVPDIHGENSWISDVNSALKEKDVTIIFLGDYVDSKWIPNVEILDNLYKIIYLRGENPDKVKLLLGNHDYAYICYGTQMSGFNFAMMHDYRYAFESNWNKFDLSWGYENKERIYTLFSHAGLTEYFYSQLVAEYYNPKSNLNFLKDNNYSLSDFINFFKDKKDILWQIGLARKGISKTGSILWADKKELLSDPFKGINQVVGHSPLLKHEKYRVNNNEDEIRFMDVKQMDKIACTYIDI